MTVRELINDLNRDELLDMEVLVGKDGESRITAIVPTLFSEKKDSVVLLHTRMNLFSLGDVIKEEYSGSEVDQNFKRVIDLLDFPRDIQEEYFNKRRGYSNGVYIEEDMVDLEHNRVNRWIVDNYKDIEKDDIVLIHYYW